MPGGGPEDGETSEETVIREVYEETTVKIGTCHFVGYQDMIRDGVTVGYQARFACLVEKIDPIQPDPAKGKTHERMFVEPEKAMQFIPYQQIEQIIDEAVHWYNSLT